MKAKLIGAIIISLLAALEALGWVGYRLFTTIPFDRREAINPVPFSQDALKIARAHFADHCSICHANDGTGKTPSGTNVYPKAPDLKSPDTQSMSDGELFWVIHNGIRFTAMPAWGDSAAENDQDSWLLIH